MTTPIQGEPVLPEQVPLLTVESAAVAPTPAPRGASPTKVFRPWSPEQAMLLPASKRDHLGDDHLAVFLLDLLPTLDLSAIRDAYAEDRGQPPYDPRMLTVLLLYAYSQRITSSRLIERRCREDVGFMYLTGDGQPDHDTTHHLAAFHPQILRKTLQERLKRDEPHLREGPNSQLAFIPFGLECDQGLQERGPLAGFLKPGGRGHAARLLSKAVRGGSVRRAK